MEYKWVDYEEWKADKEWRENHPLNHPFRIYFNLEDVLAQRVADTSVQDCGNGMYKIGNMYTGKEGLKQFDEAMKKKAKEYCNGK